LSSRSQGSYPPFVGPLLDLRTQPQKRAIATQVDDRARHVRVAALIAAHAVSHGESEDLSDATRVDEILGADKRHNSIIQVLTTAPIVS
jgi:predicted DNA-binding ribbon-helix-helix protein